MTVGQQRRTIAVSSMVVFTLGFLNAAQKEETPSARFLIGVGFTYTFISVFADLGAGDFGAGLAILILLSALIYEGEDFMALITKRAGKVKRKKRRHGEALEAAEGTDVPEPMGRKLTKLTRSQRPLRTLRR